MVLCDIICFSNKTGVVKPKKYKNTPCSLNVRSNPTFINTDIDLNQTVKEQTKLREKLTVSHVCF